MTRLFCALLALGTITFISGVASVHAAPFVEIRAFWQSFSLSVPGLEITCLGDASGGGSCGDRISLQATVTSPQSLSTVSLGGIRLTNTTDGPLPSTGPFDGFLLVEIEVSPFNLLGPSVGLSIDDPNTQAATFNSEVFIIAPPGSTPEFSDDFISCAIGFNGNSGAVLSPTTCGLTLPDSNFYLFLIPLGALTPDVPFDFNVSMGIFAEFEFLAVPEPSSAALLMLGMAGLGLLRRNRAGRLSAGAGTGG